MHSQSQPPSFGGVKTAISPEALDQLFCEARTHSAWLPEPVPVELLRKAYELARLGPTSANGNLGYGDPGKLHPGNPRLNFEEASVESLYRLDRLHRRA